MGVNSIGSMGGVDMAAMNAVAKTDQAGSDLGVVMLDKAMETQDALAGTLLSQLMDVSNLDMEV